MLRERYPAARVVAGAIRVVVSRTRPARSGTRATWPPSSSTPGAEALAAALVDAGLDVTVRADEAGLLWDKVVLPRARSPC